MIYPLDSKPLPELYTKTEVYVGHDSTHVAIEPDGIEYPIWVDPKTDYLWIEVNGEAKVLVWA